MEIDFGWVRLISFRKGHQFFIDEADISYPSRTFRDLSHAVLHLAAS